MTAEPLATVVATHRVKEGRLDAFMAQQQKLLQAVQGYSGYRNAEILPPHPGQPNIWSVIFRFRSLPELQKWIDSSERKDLLSALGPELEEATRVQILQHEEGTHTVSTVFSKRVRPEQVEAFLALRKVLHRTQEQFPGFLGNQSFAPIPGVYEEYVDISRYASQEDLDRWLNSTERAKLSEQLRPLLVEPVDVRPLATGLESWFRLPGVTPTPILPWKQALTVLLVLYPTVILVGLALTPVSAHLSHPLLMLIANGLGVLTLTWIAMPFANRMLQCWLRPEVPSRMRDLVGAGGILLVLVCLASGLHLAWNWMGTP